MHVEMGQVVASREILVDGRSVSISVGTPRRLTSSETDYCCPIEILGLGGTDPWRMLVGGVDSVQALLLALTMIGDRLNTESDRLEFLGEPTSGFPLTTAVSDSHLTATLQHRIRADPSA